MAAEVVPASADAHKVATWLRTAEGGYFKELAAVGLEGVTGSILYRYSKDDLKGICGTARGIALYNILHRELLLRRARQPASRSVAAWHRLLRPATCPGQHLARLAACSALLQTCGAVRAAVAG